MTPSPTRLKYDSSPTRLKSSFKSNKTKYFCDGKSTSDMKLPNDGQTDRQTDRQKKKQTNKR